MEFGKWELRDNGYTSYYFSKDSIIYPSSNAIDSGKLHTEENIRNIYRDLTKKNFVTKYTYFSLSLNPNRNGVIVSPGEAVIQGYHFYAKNTVEVKVPDNTIYDDSGRAATIQPITQYTLGISLSYDAANHVTGDVVNKEANVGESEVLSGVYVAWFDECQLESNYENILVLGRAWVQKGAIVQDGTLLNDERIIYHGFEIDPFKDHKFEAKTVEVEVHGHKTTKYDTLRDNMTQIHEPLYTYDSMHFPVELNRQDRTKPPSFVTDIQDYINHIPDWYTSKYGDYMTGALRFNNLSLDAKREFIKLGIIKDSVDDIYSDGVFISPRTLGDLTRDLSKKAESFDYDYNVGGTLMTIVPGTYNNGIDSNDGYAGIYASLISQMYGETGLRIHYGNSTEQSLNNTTRIVHYNETDNGQRYNTTDNAFNNTSKFIIENTDEDGRRSSINLKHGEIFIDSHVSPNDGYTEIMKYDTGNTLYDGSYRGSGIQFYVGGETTNPTNNIDFRIDETNISMAKHEYVNHRTANRGTNQTGGINDNLYFTLGAGISYDRYPNKDNANEIVSYKIDYVNTNSDPYMTLGNLRLRSNKFDGVSGYNTKQTTIELLDHSELPYLRVRPRIYSEQYVAEELIQIGTSKYDDLAGNNAQNNTHDRIVMKKILRNNPDDVVHLDDFDCHYDDNYDSINDGNYALTYFEQDYCVNNKPHVLNKLMPTTNSTATPNFNEISGMLSTGNIGCSSKELQAGETNECHTTYLNDNNHPYDNESEWVRFTRFRYDLDRDQINGGTNTEAHDSRNGRKWGDTYNIEFNTQVANRRANQIIWRYKGSTGQQDGDSLKNTPPVVLSYIHDDANVNLDETQGTHTKYTNVTGSDGYNNGLGTYETWIDHAGVTQYNPTYKTRDFLLLENAGLVVTGDINNPSLFGDSLNTSNHLGVTIVGGRVYNSVYNDFAETFEKDNKNEFAKPGTLIALNPKTGKYTICDKSENKLVVGIQSNSYAYLAGGNRINKAQDVIELENEYFTVAVSGKVWVNVVKDSNIEPGDMLTSSTEKGKATKSENYCLGTIIGKALSEPKYFKEENEYKVLVLVMTA